MEKNELKSQQFVDIIFNILGSIRQPLIVLDYDLKVVKANRWFYECFNVQPRDTEGKSLFDLGNRQWDIKRLKELLIDIILNNSQIDDFKVEHDIDGLGHRIMLLNANRILYKKPVASNLILLSLMDITEREHQKKKLDKLAAKWKASMVTKRVDAGKRKKRADATLLEAKNIKPIERGGDYHQDEIKFDGKHTKIIGQSDTLKYVLYKVEQIASSDSTVLILGETGTGKGLIAHTIHELSPRKNRKLVKVDCATLPANLIESELFGHEKGAFTGSYSKRLGRFEIANGGTIFLDEIGELPLELQAKLLRVLQDGEFERLGSSHTIKINTRIIAATNRNLEEDVRKGVFREDLWYRLNVFPITIPPLRDRQEDIPLLVNFYVQKISKRMGKSIEIIPESAMHALKNYRWPGNVRELENVIERAVIASSGPQLRLAEELNNSSKHKFTSGSTLEAIERDYIYQVLEKTKWKVSGKNSASEILGLDRSTLRARMRKLNIHQLISP